MLKTMEEMKDDGSLCDFCPSTEYDRLANKARRITECGEDMCDIAYSYYLDDNQTTENVVKYAKKVKLIKEEN